MKRLLTITIVLISLVNSFAQSWTPLTSGTTKQLRHVFFVDANTGWVVGEGGTILKTTNGGTSWSQQTLSGKDLLIGCCFVNSTTGWIGGDGGVLKTTDGGATWNYQTGPTGITKLYFLNASTGWAVGGADGSTPVYGDIYKTTDGGTTWTKQTNSSTWSRFYGVQFADANNGWAYTESNGLLIKTSDAGTTWTPQLNYGTATKIRGMHFLDKDNGWVVGYSNTSGIVLKTTNGGAQWTDAAPGLQFAVTQVQFVSKTLGWALGNGGPAGRGVINTTDGGATWKLTSTGTAVLNNLFMLNDKSGWAVGEAGVIYKYNATTGVSNHAKNTAINTFSLEQNYPNPFNPSTTINYSIASDGFVTLKVYNVLGNEVAALVNKEQAAGNYSVNFNAAGLSNGVYLYTLTSGNYSSTRKLLLLK
ncbi:MAG: YCF48-related protein [Bacillota bacterium]